MMRGKSATLVVIVSFLGACVGGGATPPSPPNTSISTSTSGTTSPTIQMPPFPAQAEGVPWPTAEWVVAEWPAQVDKTIVDEATDVAFADGSPDRVRAVVIVHEGAIVYERYSPSVTDGPDVVMPSYSMAKSVAAALVGILVRDGRIELDQPAPVPEWHADPGDPRSAITVEQMLHMSTGMEWSDGLDAGTNMSALVASPDAAGYAAAQELTWEPGERFEYNSGTSTLLARIVGDVAGEDASDMRAFMEQELFDVIGIDPVETQFDDAGTWMGAYSADTTARDYAKFGLLHLRGGQWDGAQVLPEEWVEFVRTPSPTSPEYGGHWWLDTTRPGMFHAIGIRGNVITVDPANDLVIVQLGTVPGPLPLEHFEAIMGAFEAADS
jgi:CubicO group peptidase (beta-lactamase class C family)